MIALEKEMLLYSFKYSLKSRWIVARQPSQITSLELFRCMFVSSCIPSSRLIAIGFSYSDWFCRHSCVFEMKINTLLYVIIHSQRDTRKRCFVDVDVRELHLIKLDSS